MKNEAEFCTVIVKSLDLGYKIPDPNGAYAMTVKRCFDIMGGHHFDGGVYHPVYIEAKFNKTMSAFNLKRIEPHQSYFLSEFNLINEARCFLILGVYAGRGDTRAYVFNWADLKPYYEAEKSIHAKMLEKLPYNPVTKGTFQFEKIITDVELSQIFA